LLVEPDHDEQLTHLRCLAVELERRGFASRLLDAAGVPCIKVANPDSPELNERVLCSPAADGSWCFWWPWRQPIGSADDLPAVSRKIMTVLRSVQGAS
jgi:hypothetical protein